MRGKASIACDFPAAIRQEMNRQQHLHDTLPRGQEVLWLVEDAMAQTGTDQDAEEAVNKEGVKVLVLDLLFLIQPLHDQIC